MHAYQQNKFSFSPSYFFLIYSCWRRRSSGSNKSLPEFITTQHTHTQLSFSFCLFFLILPKKRHLITIPAAPHLPTLLLRLFRFVASRRRNIRCFVERNIERGCYVLHNTTIRVDIFFYFSFPRFVFFLNIF